MTPPDKNSAVPLLCVSCGRPIAKGLHCAECVNRGLAPCEACEGLSFEDLEEDAS
jgi:hypothetical protein